MPPSSRAGKLHLGRDSHLLGSAAAAAAAAITTITVSTVSIATICTIRAAGATGAVCIQRICRRPRLRQGKSAQIRPFGRRRSQHCRMIHRNCNRFRQNCRDLHKRKYTAYLNRIVGAQLRCVPPSMDTQQSASAYARCSPRLATVGFAPRKMIPNPLDYAHGFFYTRKRVLGPNGVKRENTEEVTTFQKRRVKQTTSRQPTGTYFNVCNTS
jgi:hypothetical protein